MKKLIAIICLLSFTQQAFAQNANSAGKVSRPIAEQTDLQLIKTLSWATAQMNVSCSLASAAVVSTGLVNSISGLSGLLAFVEGNTFDQNLYISSDEMNTVLAGGIIAVPVDLLTAAYDVLSNRELTREVFELTKITYKPTQIVNADLFHEDALCEKSARQANAALEEINKRVDQSLQRHNGQRRLTRQEMR